MTALAMPSALSGCDIRLEDDAPSLPLLSRKSIPDEAVLIDAVRRTGALAQLAGRVANPAEAVTNLGRLHRTQADVLRGRLTSRGVPNHVIDTPTASTTTSATAAVSAPPTATAADLVAAETATVAALLPRLGAVTAANLSVLTSVTAFCAAAVEQLGGTLTWPASDPLPPASAGRLLDDTRAAEYAFQVVAAQTTGPTRGAALATATELGVRESELVAMVGAAAAPAPLGYALPFPVTTPETAARLAAQVLSSLVAGGLAPVASLAAGSSAVATVVRLEATAQHLGGGWGVASVPFPGMTYP
ncbi:MAG: DUF4439 domain-containing protein [Actinomycetota bacterium]|nr:DUF4439 domain-containing protein [Actinomycetota bacterium]